VVASLLLAAALAAAPSTPAATPSTPAARSSAAAAPAPKGAPKAPPKAPPLADPVLTVREAEARVLEALQEGAGQEALGALAAEYVDYQRLARRSLGAHWARQKKAEQAALVAALRALLEATYLSRVQPGAAVRTEVTVVRRKEADAELRVVAGAGERQVPLELRLERGRDGRWRVYDATVAGLALLEGYQEQFPQLLQLGGMPRLLAQLETERQAQLRRQAPPPAPAGPPPAR
jgi:ABC-type transporter MlaC component